MQPDDSLGERTYDGLVLLPFREKKLRVASLSKRGTEKFGRRT